jgi:hypothetical protein
LIERDVFARIAHCYPIHTPGAIPLR